MKNCNVMHISTFAEIEIVWLLCTKEQFGDIIIRREVVLHFLQIMEWYHIFKRQASLPVYFFYLERYSAYLWHRY